MASRPPREGSAPPEEGRAGGAGANRMSIEGVRGTRRVEPTTAVSAAAPVASVERVDAAAAVQALKPAQAVEAAAAILRTQAVDKIAGIAERLRQGGLSSAQAVEELIDDAVSSALRGVPADSPLVAELRALLRAYAQDDPYLQSRISRLAPDR